MPAEIRIVDIPEALTTELVHDLGNYMLGFVIVDADGVDARLAGSGTLVRKHNKFAILTAAHVVEHFPKSGRLGVIVNNKKAAMTTIDLESIAIQLIAHGNDLDGLGPDLALVRLSDEMGSALSAKRSSVDLNRLREQRLTEPWDFELGIWASQGFVDEYTQYSFTEGGRQLIKQFYNLLGHGLPIPPQTRGEFDYVDITVKFDTELRIPSSFQGMSGGALWHVLIKEDGNGGFLYLRPRLSGVIFFETAVTDGMRFLRCHGPSSIDTAVLDAFRI